MLGFMNQILYFHNNFIITIAQAQEKVIELWITNGIKDKITP